MNKINKRLFVDMDGTLAVFTPVDTLEKLYEPGYYESLEPIDNVVDSVKTIINDYPGIQVNILSAYLSDSPYALDEKNAWLDRFLPEISAENRIFMPCGDNKLEYIPGGAASNDFLLDDYTHNLTLWEPPARGIKLLNGINHTNETWSGDMVSFNRESEVLADTIVSVMNGDHVYDNKPRHDANIYGKFKNHAGYYIIEENKNYAFGYSPAAPDSLVIWHRDRDGDYHTGHYGSSFSVSEYAEMHTSYHLNAENIMLTLESLRATDYIKVPAENETAQYTELTLSKDIEKYQQEISQLDTAEALEKSFKLHTMNELYMSLSNEIANERFTNEELMEISQSGMDKVYDKWIQSDYSGINEEMQDFINHEFGQYAIQHANEQEFEYLGD